MKRFAHGNRLYVTTLLVFLCLTALTILFSYYLQTSFETQLAKEFQNRTVSITNRLEQRITSYEHGIRGTRSALLAGGVTSMSLDEFRMIMSSRDPDVEFPGIRGFGYIERVPAKSVEDFISKTRVLRHDDFTLKELSSHSGERFIIKYIEPEIHNKEAVGLDISSEENRRVAMLRAMRSGSAVLTQPITLVQASGKLRHGFLLLVPIYSNHEVPDDPDTRQKLAIGAAYAPLLIDEVLDPILDEEPFNLRISGLDGGKPNFFYETNKALDSIGLKSVQTLTVFGQSWQLEYTATPTFYEAFYHPPQIAVNVIGFLLALLLSFLTYLEMSHRRKLRSQASTLQTLMKHTPSSIALLDKNLSSVVQTARWTEDFGQKENIPLSEHSQPMVNRLIKTDELKTALTGKSVAKHSERYEKPDGTNAWYRVAIEPWFADDGPVGGVIVIAEDITELSDAQERLEESNRNLETQVAERTAELQTSTREIKVLAQAIDSQLMYSVTDKDGIIETVNKNFCERVEYTADELIGNTHRLIDSESHEPEFWKSLWDNIKHGRPWRNEVCNRTKSGHLIWWDSVVFPVLNADGDVQSYVSISQDITQSHQMQDALKVAVSEANRANLAKSQFLSTMSHEIRTPLNAMVGMLYLLKRTSLEDAQRQLVDNINIASETLLLLINDILDFSKIESGELRLEKHQYELTHLLNELKLLFSIQAENKNLQLNVGSPPDSLPRYLIGDSTRLKQMLVNLLSNAIKFTSSGDINLSIKEMDRTDERITLQFEVTDTGIGIKKDVQATIFDSFTQADTSTTRNFGGSGLGLSIVKRLAQAMGGDVEVESTPGLGSTFSFTIKLGYSNNVDHEPRHSSGSRSLRIIIADDNATEREVLLSMSSELGWDATAVSSGKDLINSVLTADAPYDCIIADWRMPEIDGLEAIQRIHQSLGESMPGVIMVTSYDRENLLSDAKALLADSVLGKPVQKSSLFNSVNEAAINNGMDSDHVLDMTKISLGEHHLWLDGMHILVVDDNEMNLLMTKKVLEIHGATADVSNSGENAIAQLQQHESEYDAILMDVQMPEMSGLEATEIIRKDLKLTLPILAVTAGVSLDEKESVLESGMDDFLSKPVEPEKIIRLLWKHVARGKMDKAIDRDTNTLG